MRFVHRQMSPMISRALRQWDNGVASGMIQVNTARDVLPPELLINLENLRPPSPPASESININDPSKDGSITSIPLIVGVASQLILRASPTKRNFLFIQNTHGTQTLFVTFGRDSNALIGLQIPPLLGAIGFDEFVPQDEVYLVGSGALTTGVCLYSNKE